MRVVKAAGILALGFMLTLILFPWLDTLRDTIYTPNDDALYEYLNTGDDAEVSLYSDNWAMQVFTATESHRVQHIKLKMWRDGAGSGILYVDFYAAYANGNPYGDALASASLPAASFTASSPGTWKNFELGDIDIAAGATYAVVCHYDETATEVINWRVVTNAGAHYAYSLDAGESWVWGEFPEAPGVDMYGAGANPTGDPVGGGYGYTPDYDEGDADWLVYTGAELMSVLSDNVSYGEVVYVADNATVNLTGQNGIDIPAGVILAGGRGQAIDDDGGLIMTDLGIAGEALFEAGDNVIMTGLRIQGPDTSMTGTVLFTAVLVDGVQNFQIDNCEIWGFTYAAVSVIDTPNEATVKHCYIHECQMTGYGYGVLVSYCDVLAEANIFDFCRHAIEVERSGPGFAAGNLEACYNIVEPSFTGRTTQSNAMFDVRGGNDDSDMEFAAGPDCDYDAGGTIYLHHNTFRCNTWEYDGDTYYRSAIHVRGVPDVLCTVSWNWFYHELYPWTQETVVAQSVENLEDLGCSTGAYDQMTVSNNWYGVAMP